MRLHGRLEYKCMHGMGGAVRPGTKVIDDDYSVTNELGVGWEGA